jgi:hypothetical protein
MRVVVVVHPGHRFAGLDRDRPGQERIGIVVGNPDFPGTVRQLYGRATRIVIVITMVILIVVIAIIVVVIAVVIISIIVVVRIVLVVVPRGYNSRACAHAHDAGHHQAQQPPARVSFGCDLSSILDNVISEISDHDGISGNLQGGWRRHDVHTVLITSIRHR